MITNLNIVYQLGNLATSGSSTIEAELGTRFPLNKPGFPDAYNYGRVMGIFCGAVFAYVMLIIFLGPERFHQDLSTNRNDLEETEELSDVLVVEEENIVVQKQ
ncbi:unnamed protein product [Debaryomyces tyrocola]|nr:unnamed protein product [Debaryomyces tyrocola]